MHGVYHSCGETDVHSYLAECGFRYSRRSALGVSDIERARAAVKAAEGKRLTYWATH